MTRHVPGQGRNNMYVHGAAIGGPDALHRMRMFFYDEPTKEARIDAMYLIYMAQDAGGGLVQVPLESLRKFADLVRADTRSACRSEIYAELRADLAAETDFDADRPARPGGN